MNIYLIKNIDNYGNSTNTIMQLDKKELEILIKFAKENNKNSNGVYPKIEIYNNFTINSVIGLNANLVKECE